MASMLSHVVSLIMMIKLVMIIEKIKNNDFLLSIMYNEIEKTEK